MVNCLIIIIDTDGRNFGGDDFYEYGSSIVIKLITFYYVQLTYVNYSIYLTKYDVTRLIHFVKEKC